MLRKLVLLLLAVILLAGCGDGGDDNQLSTDYLVDSRMGKPRSHDGQGLEIRILPYFGAPLYCIEGSHVGGTAHSLTCDFVRWHKENPNP